MKRLILILLTIIFLFGCKKEQLSAPNVSQDLLGTWYEKDGMQITIENKVFLCQCISFREWKDVYNRYLDLTLNEEKTTFQIMEVKKHSMTLKVFGNEKTHYLIRID